MKAAAGVPAGSVDLDRRDGPSLGPALNSREAIASALAERILSGELAAGERLPSERHLALEYGASRPIVREALRSLVERGLIEVGAGRGAFVRGEMGPRGYQPLAGELRAVHGGGHPGRGTDHHSFHAHRVSGQRLRPASRGAPRSHRSAGERNAARGSG